MHRPLYICIYIYIYTCIYTCVARHDVCLTQVECVNVEHEEVTMLPRTINAKRFSFKSPPPPPSPRLPSLIYTFTQFFLHLPSLWRSFCLQSLASTKQLLLLASTNNNFAPTDTVSALSLSTRSSFYMQADLIDPIASLYAAAVPMSKVTSCSFLNPSSSTKIVFPNTCFVKHTKYVFCEKAVGSAFAFVWWS